MLTRIPLSLLVVAAAAACGPKPMTLVTKARASAAHVVDARGELAFADGDALRVVIEPAADVVAGGSAAGAGDSAFSQILDVEAPAVEALAIGPRAVAAVEGGRAFVHTVDGTAKTEPDLDDPALAVAALDDGFVLVTGALDHADDADGDGARETGTFRLSVVQTDELGAVRSRAPVHLDADAPLALPVSADHKAPRVAGVVVDGSDVVFAWDSVAYRIDRQSGASSVAWTGDAAGAVGLDAKGKLVVTDASLPFYSAGFAASADEIVVAADGSDAGFAVPGKLMGLAANADSLFVTTSSGVFAAPLP